MLTKKERTDIVNFIFKDIYERAVESNVIELNGPSDLDRKQEELDHFLKVCESILKEWNIRELSKEPDRVQAEIEHMIEIEPGLYIKDEESKKSLHEYMKSHGEKIKREILNMANGGS